MVNSRSFKNKFNRFKQIFFNKQVLIGLFATLILLIIFRMGANLTLPGVQLSSSASSINTDKSFLGIMNILGGGGISQLSFMAIGVSPYITAQIIVQLLSSDIIKPLSNLSKMGEKGKRKIEVITRLLTLPFAIMQAYAVLSLATQQGYITLFGQTSIASIDGSQVFVLLLGLTVGSYLTIFIADMISKRGIGNGVTLVIVSGIVSSLFSNFTSVFQILIQNNTQNNILINYLSFILYIIFFVVLLVAVVFISGATRKIPIQQIGQGLSTKVDEMPYLPIKLNPSGVIPIIFASSVMTIPPTIAQFLPQNTSGTLFINSYLAIETPVGLTIYAILIILFGFFYSHIQVNSEKLSENFKKSGKYIPGIKAGEETQKYISRTLNRINCIGVPILTIIAILPYIISMTTPIPNGLALGGTGIIIMITGSLEFWQSLKSSNTNYRYSNLTKTIKKSTEKSINENSKDDNDVQNIW